MKRFRYIARDYGGDEAQDLLQEILLQVWRSLPKFGGKSKIDSWVYRIALNTAISHLRGVKRKPVFEAGIDMDQAIGPDTIESGTEGEILQSFASGLNRIDRAILLLYMEDKSYEEMAEIMGINTNQLGVRLSRLKSAFKMKFTEA